MNTNVFQKNTLAATVIFLQIEKWFDFKNLIAVIFHRSNIQNSYNCPLEFKKYHFCVHVIFFQYWNSIVVK